MKNKPTKISKGLSISKDLLTKTLARAKNEDRSFSYIVCRAIKRDLDSKLVKPLTATAREQQTAA